MDEKKTVGQATASMVLGILSFILLGLLTAIPAVICGHIAKKKIKHNPDQLKGEGSALAGLIMGYIAIGLNVLVIGIAILAALTIPLMSGNMERAMSVEGQVGCESIGAAIKYHWVVHEESESIESPVDLEGIGMDDLDGYYFQTEDYTLVSFDDAKNYVVQALGGNDDITVRVYMMVVDGETIWETDTLE